MKIKKRAQVTLFIIVGLIIILGSIVFFYSTREAQQQFEPEIKIIQEQVPVEFNPIRNYVSDCVYSVGVEGLEIIGQQGGYISYTDKTLNKETFAITQNPTESDLVSFSRNSGLKIPYWWYLKSANNCNNNCMFASKRPDLRQSDNSIEKQLERYIDAKLDECIKDFAQFKEQGYVITKTGKVKADVTIASDDVLVLVEYPLNVKKENAETKITQFLAGVPISLDKIYDLATKITNLEINYSYLEKHVLDLIVAFSGVDKDKLPPMSDLQFKFGSTISWQKSDVKNKLTDVLSSYIPLFQVDGTYNYERNVFNSQLKQRLYDSTIIPIANSSFKDLSAYFTYLDFWPIYFDLNCDGERCIPSSASSLFSFFGIQDYKFAYDVSFPVLVEVQDPFALNGQGYSFYFFLEGNIRNNKRIKGDFSQLERASLSERSLLCDVRTSGNVTVKVEETANKKPVEDAQVLYTLIDESCFIGSTDKNGILKEQFPIGVGGVANIIRDGYIGRSIEFDPRINKEDSLKIPLSKIFTKNITVKKKNVAKTAQGWRFVNEPVDLNEKEQATLTLTRISDGTELDFSAVSSYIGKQTEESIVEIAPGNYAADFNLILNDRIVIPEREKCVTKLFGKKQCVKIPKVDFGQGASPGQARFPEGGLKLNFTIKPEDLENSNTITFYVVSIDFAGIPEQQRYVEDLSQMNKIEEYSNIYQVNLQPAFK